MGTTQRIIPGVTGEPNWPNLSGAITDLANTIEKETEVADEIDKEKEAENADPARQDNQGIQKLERQQIKLQARKNQHFKSALQNLIKTGGGRINISRGRSASLGRAGIRTSSRISGFVHDVYRNGLQTTLIQIGFGSLEGKAVSEVVDYLLVYFADVSAGMDDVAANMASCEVLEELASGVTTLEKLEEKMSSLVEENGLTELICKFYGIYLFEHLSQRFEERITQLKGEVVSRETFTTIKEDIIGQIRGLSQERELSKIDWRGQQGTEIQNTIFQSIIQLFE